MSNSDQEFVSEQPLLQEIVELALQKKAKNLIALDVRGLSSVADFFVICSGDSDPQVKAISDSIRKGTPQKPKHMEGYENLNWVLIDYFDVLVHIFNNQERGYYGLERLWADAPINKFNNETPEKQNN
ncbi:MAG: ribosome silencing factor [Candidatus Marinimicrobia bacterium]|nr:ribosome silencing factor [Candidatus Neomarinimicrobiota bacterium]